MCVAYSYDGFWFESHIGLEHLLDNAQYTPIKCIQPVKKLLFDILYNWPMATVRTVCWDMPCLSGLIEKPSEFA